MKFFLKISILLLASEVFAQGHPCLMLTPSSVAEIRANLGKAPLFDKELASTVEEVNQEIALGIFVPIPKDMAGGYTHERHKQNFFILQKAGALFQITGDEKYAVYVRDMLLQYTKIYRTLPKHPTNQSYATGKVFWQCLNDANWLVYVSQAYDCIYDWLPLAQRKVLEKDLFRPFADYLSIDNPQFFNRIHNHSTWANAAVGMIGLVMQDSVLIDRALYGLKNDGLSENQKDNDGGYIKIAGVRKAGFLAQLDLSFSPDGYFTEGPYYLRYALTPFLLFAKSLANNRPDLHIMQYREGILMKAVEGLLNQSDFQGQFFPLNDAQKGMSWLSREVISGVDIAYFNGEKNPALLSIAQLQDRVLLDETGFAVARDLAKGLAKPFQHQSQAYLDGPDGTQGGIAILRTPSSSGENCLVMKYSAQGMGHGHFDKLSYSFYDELGEIVQDYGAARWVNIDQKGGGRYLPENQTFAKQTIAHNTVVVDQKSHYDGDVEKGEANSPQRYFFEANNDSLQIVSAKDAHATPGVEMHRTMLLLKNKQFQFPLLIDIFRLQSETAHQYDLPLWFQGHLLLTNFDFKTELTALAPLGTAHGYQHLWKEAVGQAASGKAQINWFNHGRFFTLTSAVSPEDEIIFGRSGASDPLFNLRHDPVCILRKNASKNAVYLSVIESHGEYNPVEEIPNQPYGTLASLDLIFNDLDYTVFQFSNKNGDRWEVMLANQDASPTAIHRVKTAQKRYEWQGMYQVIALPKNGH